MASISKPVGLSPSRSFNDNNPRDVKTVQGLLLVASSLQNRRDWDPGPITGRMMNSKADKTVRAILAFQRPFFRNPTGTIDPGSVTMLKLNEFTRLKINRNSGPVLIPIAKSRRVVGKNYDGSKAEDLKYGQYSAKQLKRIRVNFMMDDMNFDLETVSADKLFKDFKTMATGLFSTNNWPSSGKTDMQNNILRMIDKFKSNTGGTYSDPALNNWAKRNGIFMEFERELQRKLHIALKKNKGNVNNFKSKRQARLKINSKIKFNTWKDIFGGMTIATHDIWAWEVNLIDYELSGLDYKGTYKISLYDHFGLDRPDVDDNNSSGFLFGKLAGFRAWFILQHLNRFAYKPFITVIDIENKFHGSITTP